MHKPELYTTTCVCYHAVVLLQSKQSLQSNTAAVVTVAKLMQLAVGMSCGLAGCIFEGVGW